MQSRDEIQIYFIPHEFRMKKETLGGNLAACVGASALRSTWQRFINESDQLISNL